MKIFFVIIALSLFPASSSAGDRGISDLVHQMRGSTNTVESSRWGQHLSQEAPHSREEITTLLEAMDNSSIAPYAQASVARATEPATGPAIHAGLRKLRGSLKTVPERDFEKMSPSQRDAYKLQIMNILALTHAIGNMKYKPAVADLRELLDSDDKYNGVLAWEASRILGEMGDDQALSMIEKKLGQNKPISLSGFGAKGIRKIVQRVESIEESYKSSPKKSGDPREEQIGALRNDLGRIRSNNREAKAALRQLLAHRNIDVQWGAAVALITTLDSKDRDISLEMLRHKEGFVRAAGLDSLRLSKTWDKTLFPVVIEMLRNDPDQEVRGKSAHTLRNLTALVPKDDLREAVPYLEAALSDKSIHVRYEAAGALSAITGRAYSFEGMSDRMRVLMERRSKGSGKK